MDMEQGECKSCDKLAAENQRLREALERLLDDESRCDADWIIARAALEVKP